MSFSPSRSARRARASLLLSGVLICVILAAVGATVPANKCPDHIDCARKGRHFCKPGSSYCGPCLSPLEENEAGHCVSHSTHVPRHHSHGISTASHPVIDEEIDYLSSVIAKQQMSQVKQPDSRSQSPPQSQSESKQKSLNKATTVEPKTSGPLIPTHQTPKPPQPVTNSSHRHGPIISPHSSRDSLLVLMISLCIIVGSMALIIAAVCWVRVQRETRLAQKVDYPAFHAAGPNNNYTSVRAFTLMPVHTSKNKISTLTLLVIDHVFPCFSLGIQIWLTVLRCITTSIRNNRCFQWRNIKQNLKSQSLGLHQKRRMKWEISLCTSALDWHRLERWK
uniref:Neural proliferation, differentiation and control, 1a n=1 Tax=Cyprinus carpio TaxID=7962 RepID=A0A8C2JJW8_CYPCA